MAHEGMLVLNPKPILTVTAWDDSLEELKTDLARVFAGKWVANLLIEWDPHGVDQMDESNHRVFIRTLQLRNAQSATMDTIIVCCRLLGCYFTEVDE